MAETVIGCGGLLWLAAFPFITIFAVARRPGLPLAWFLVPLLSGIAIAFTRPDAENAAAAVMWGAASSALATTFGLFKRRTAGRSIALAVEIVIAIAAWWMIAR